MRMLIAALAVLLFVACKPSTYRQWADYVIQVEEIQVPETVAPGGSLNVVFHGLVGPTSCHRFHEFITQATPSRLDMIAIGRYESGTCQTIPVYFEGRTYTHNGPFTDPFTIGVHQADGTVMERQVRVQ